VLFLHRRRLRGGRRRPRRKAGGAVSSLDRFGLAGRVAVVTGASRGIGRAIAAGLAEAGAAVVCASRSLDACAEVAGEIEASGGRAVPARLDLGDPTTHAGVIELAVQRFGRLDVLVNNAGILKPHLTVKVTPAELAELVAVNLQGPVQLSVAALDHLGEHGVGSIVNIGALCAYQPMEGIGAYCAVKAAMANWSTTMAREWVGLGVRVNVLVPGSIGTDMILPRDPERREAFAAELATQNAFGRLGEPDDVVGAAIYLAGDASSFVTGRAMFVDGGLLR
ncbi:MAG: SDR family oxidoreductase, partial [Acidimicrobiales bacterium]|nr:SDR family oxidoreductase [Acidimicrobiales bacterium]